MMKKVIVLAMMLMLTGCAPAEGREEGHSSMMVTAMVRLYQHIVMEKM